MESNVMTVFLRYFSDLFELARMNHLPSVLNKYFMIFDYL